MPVSATPAAAPVVAREQQRWAPLEPLLPPPRQEPPACGAAAAIGSGSFPWLATAAGFGYLTLTSGMALHRSRGDPGAAAFVVAAYADLALLFCCLRMYERAEPGSARRERLKLAVWLLATALTLLFSCKVAAVMPPAAAALVWVMGLATVAGGFAALFCFEAGHEMAVADETLHAHAPSSPALFSPVSAPTHDAKQVFGGTRKTPPSLDASIPDAHTRRACGVISP